MVKREQCRDGMLTREQIWGDTRTPGGVEALKQSLQAASPQGRIDQLKKLAAQVNIDPPELDQAQDLLKASGNYDRINSLLLKAERQIQNKALDPVLPMAGRDQRTQQGRSEGGRRSRGLEPEGIAERDRLMQKNINRLCLENGHSYKAACELTARDIKKIHPLTLKISYESVKKRTINPRQQKRK